MRITIHAVRCVLVLLTASCLAATTALAQQMTDPYAILNRHAEATGGLDLIKAEKTRYFEGRLSVFGLEGTIRQWEMAPIAKRQEVDVGIFKQTSGDNGEFAWVVDQNGKLQIKRDDRTLKKRRVEELMGNYEYLNPASEFFRLTLEGIQTVGSADCYVIRIANTINDDVRTDYINTSNFNLEKSVMKEADMELHTVFSDLRDVGGRKVPFRHDIEVLPFAQKQTIQLAKYESNMAVDLAQFDPPEEGALDFEFTEGDSAVDIPFQYIGDHVFLEVAINCEERLWCLDTGAAATVIDPAYASQLGLEPSGSAKGLGAGKMVDIAFVALPPFSVDGIRFKEQKVASVEVAPLFRRAGMDVVGVLGYDFLSRFVTRIDFARRKISFYHPKKFDYSGGVAIDAQIKNNLFWIPATVDGRYSGLWSVDIGASGSAFFYPFAESSGLLGRKGVESRAGGAGGFFGMRVSRFEELEIAGFKVMRPLVSIPVERSGALGTTEGVGNLGNDALRHFVLYLDYERQRVIFEKGADFDREFPEGKSGMGLVVADDGGIQVFYVTPRSPAARAGFREGDTILSINGIPVGSFSGLPAISELFRAQAGTAYRVVIRRDGRERRLRLILKDML